MNINFIKFLPEEYNPKNGYSKIQLGTLLYYSEMENNKGIADKNEGLNRILLGDYDGKTADISIKNKIPCGESKAKGFIIESRTPNCYIYCLSMNKENKIKGQQFCDNYNSSFKVKDIDNFSNIIGNCLFRKIEIHHFEESSIKSIVSKLNFKNKLKLHVLHKPVTYNGIKTSLIYDNKIWKNKYIPEPLEIIFTKDEGFATDDEYRIVFVFVYNDIILSVKKDPILLSCKEIRNYIE